MHTLALILAGLICLTSVGGGMGFVPSPAGILSMGLVGSRLSSSQSCLRAGRRAAGMISRLRSSSEGVGMVVLDFDGVLCDGQEKTRSAWRTGLRKWPDVMGMAKDITPQEAGVRSSWVGYEWSSYEEDNGDDIPRWLEEKLKQVRPVLSSSAELVLAARLCVSEAIAGRKNKGTGRRPLTAGEILENWEEMKDILYMKCNSTEEELAQLFDEERRMWMQNDEEGWVESSCMYPGVAEALRGQDNFYVLTSSDLDSMNAVRVLRRNGVKLPDERIIECRGDKASALVAVVENIRRRAHLRFGPPPGDIVYVEDDVSTIQKMAGDLRLANCVNIHFATWGHSTSKSKATVAAWPRVKNLDVDSLKTLVCNSRPEEA